MIVEKSIPNLFNLGFWEVYENVKIWVETDFLAHVSHVQILAFVLGIYLYRLNQVSIHHAFCRIGMTSI